MGNKTSTNEDSVSRNDSNIASSCYTFAESGDLRGLVGLLVRDPSLINGRSISKLETILHVSAAFNRYEIVKYMLEWTGTENIELEATNIYGETPLHLTAKNGCIESARMLLHCGANVHARTEKQMTPLHLAALFAVESGDDSVVKLLLEFNADCSAADNEGNLPFSYIPKTCDEHKELRNDHDASDGTKAKMDASDHELSNTQLTDKSVEEPRNDDDDSDGTKAKMDAFNHELSKIVGLRGLKQQLQTWAKGMLLDEKRRATGINLGKRKQPHMAFLGNPGTGKTTLARILGNLLHSVGVLSSNKMIEVRRTDLVGEFIGQTGLKTRKKIEEAWGGILFVDEAYQLAPKHRGVDFGREALEEIMSVLEDGDLVLIFAGYTEPMKDVFSSNEGFCRRVTHHFQFEDYSSQDLAEMLMLKMGKQDEKSRFYGFKLEEGCTLDVVASLMEKKSSEKLRNKLNGGLVDHMLNNARENLDSRLTLNSKGEELFTIRLVDLEAGLELLSQRLQVE